MDRSKPLAIVLTCVALLQSDMLFATQVAVRRAEGLVHGFLSLSTMEGKLLADGDLIQVSHGNRVTTHLVFQFKDGSLHDETAIFSQRGNFRLLSYHLVQKGPAFPNDVTLTAAAPPSAPVQQTVGQNVRDRVRSQSSNPPAKNRAPDKRC